MDTEEEEAKRDKHQQNFPWYEPRRVARVEAIEPDEAKLVTAAV